MAHLSINLKQFNSLKTSLKRWAKEGFKDSVVKASKGVTDDIKKKIRGGKDGAGRPMPLA